MNEHPYAKFNPEELILRDHLATDRTVLANERTLLAYVRTTLAFLAVGGSFIQFFDSLVLTVTGWGLILLGSVLLITGITHFLRMKARIGQAKQAQVQGETDRAAPSPAPRSPRAEL